MPWCLVHAVNTTEASALAAMVIALMGSGTATRAHAMEVRSFTSIAGKD
ncbi:hypothetical protein ACWEV3_12465 [Saccharopolyspora sp. NPDC003752]